MSYNSNNYPCFIFFRLRMNFIKSIFQFKVPFLLSLTLILSTIGLFAKSQVLKNPKIIHQTALLVNKADKKLYLLKQNKGKWTALDSFNVATGRNEGNKQIEGDLKTPEGYYYVVDIDDGPSNGKLYGPIVFKLNYPNKDDLAVGKTGSGIWVHGVEFGKAPDWTRGCISILNKEVIRLIHQVHIGTKIAILDTLRHRNYARYFTNKRFKEDWLEVYEERVLSEDNNHERLNSIYNVAGQYVSKEEQYFARQEERKLLAAFYDSIEQVTVDWSKAWASMDINKLRKSFHPNYYSSRFKNLELYLNHKLGLFVKTDSIKVELANYDFEKISNNEVIAYFDQRYRSFVNNYPTEFNNRKKLRLYKHQDQWQIIGEETNRDFPKLKLDPPEPHQFGGHYALISLEAQKLYVVQTDAGNWKVVEEIPIATGKNPGGKTKEGDGKTPIGEYYITSAVAGKYLSEKYGALAFEINYPNQKDLIAGHTGDGIKISGIEMDTEPTPTWGSISMSNKNIVKLTNYLTVGTPITIVQSTNSTDLINDYFPESRLQKDWPLISELFIKQSTNSKKRIAQAFQTAKNFIKAEEELLIAKAEKARREQERLALLEQQKREEAERKKLLAQRKQLEKQRNQLLLGNLNKWEQAWEEKDLNELSSYFHPRFNSRRYSSIEDYLDNKKRIFMHTDSIKIKRAHYNFKTLDSNIVEARYTQVYKGWSNNQVKQFNSSKTIQFAKLDQNWLIIKEE